LKNFLLACSVLVVTVLHAQKKSPTQKLKSTPSESLYVYVIDSTASDGQPKRITNSPISVATATRIKELKLSSSAYKMLGFVLIIGNSSHDPYIVQNKTSVLGEDALRFIEKSTKGETIVFDEIRVETKKGKIITLKPFALKVE